MKTKRQNKILELIEEHAIETQEDLLALLRESGYSVTQATVSRDVKELRLVKTLTPEGKYHYATHSSPVKNELSNKFMMIFSESVKEIDAAGNMLVIKCYTGMANAVCEILDTIQLNGVVGTLAGDNTIFMVMRNENYASDLVLQLKEMLKEH